MLQARLTELRARLDALRGGTVRSPSFSARAIAFFDRVEGLSPMAELSALDRDFDVVGIHTAADASLLRELGVQKGRAAVLAKGLEERARRAFEEYDDCVRRAERAILAERPIAGALTQLEEGFVKLGRALKVADLFAAPLDSPAPRFEIFGVPKANGKPPSSSKVAIAQFWSERARRNPHDLVQKRRDLDAAHELLLRTPSDLDRDHIRRLRMEVSDARERLKPLPAVRSVKDLVTHVKLAARRDPRAAYRSLRALYERAVEAGEPALADAAAKALTPLLPGRPQLRDAMERSEARPWGPAPERVDPGTLQPVPSSTDGPHADDVLARLAYQLDDDQLSLFELADGCARYFDVDDALAQEVVEAELEAARPRAHRVPYPTQQMTFDSTGSLHELHNFVISDPRMFLYDLASNRQQVRAYLEADAPRVGRQTKRTAVRVYVCDASGSMHGSRARFRDAILIAELNNLRLKAQRREPFDPLYFSFFNDTPTELARVDTAAEATRQMERLFDSSPAQGQTDISLALMSAFDSIRAAQGTDPYLSRATVVLVTDGEDRVDLELIRKMRTPIDSVEIALSFISLGEENPDLRALALEQRSGGTRAFYHHLSDYEIGAARTEFDRRWRTLLPVDLPATANALELLLPHLEALERIAARLSPSVPARSAVSFDALFPAPPTRRINEAATESPDGLRIADILEAVAEAGSLAPLEQRGEESGVLLQHLLALYGLTVPQYLAILEKGGASMRRNIERVRLLCRPFG